MYKEKGAVNMSIFIHRGEVTFQNDSVVVIKKDKSRRLSVEVPDRENMVTKIDFIGRDNETNQTKVCKQTLRRF